MKLTLKGLLVVAGTAVMMCAGDSPPLVEVFTNSQIDNHMVLQSDIQSEEFTLECPYHKSEPGEQ